MIVIRTRLLSLFMTGLMASAAFAGGIEKDPKGEGRKDPNEKREEVQNQRAEVNNLKREQLLIRLRLKQRIEELKRVQELKSKTAQKDEQGQDAKIGPISRKKIPVKQFVKPKVLAKVLGRNDRFEVKAVGMDGEARRIEAEFKTAVEAELNDKPIFFEHMSTRGRYPDPGRDVMERLNVEERNQNQKELAQLEREALEKIGNMPEIEYDISQTPAERKEAMGSPNVLSSRENIRRWRQVAVWDPSRDVRVAALGRLQRAGEGLALRYVLSLKDYEQQVFKDLDPYDASARAFLQGLIDHDVGNEAVRRVAATLLYKFPVPLDATGEVNWVTLVEAGENPEVLPEPADFLSDDTVRANEAKARAENAAVKASPYAAILEPFPEAVRRALVAFDPATPAGYRKLQAFASGEEELAEVSGAYEPDVKAAAAALLATQPAPKVEPKPKAKKPKEKVEQPQPSEESDSEPPTTTSHGSTAPVTFNVQTGEGRIQFDNGAFRIDIPIHISFTGLQQNEAKFIERKLQTFFGHYGHHYSQMDRDMIAQQFVHRGPDGSMQLNDPKDPKVAAHYRQELAKARAVGDVRLADLYSEILEAFHQN